MVRCNYFIIYMYTRIFFVWSKSQNDVESRQEILSNSDIVSHQWRPYLLYLLSIIVLHKHIAGAI